MVPLEANLGILSQSWRDHVHARLAETQTCNQLHVEILCKDPGAHGRADKVVPVPKKAGWLQGNDDKEGLVSRTAAQQSSGNWPYFMVNALDPPHTNCVTWGKLLLLSEPHFPTYK